MLRRKLNLILGDTNDLLQRPQLARLRPAQNLIPRLVFGPRRVIFPAPARRQDDLLPKPGFRGGGAERGDDAEAVCEEGDSEGRGGVEVLAQEEVAVVEGGGVEGYEEVVWAWRGGWDIL